MKLFKVILIVAAIVLSSVELSAGRGVATLVDGGTGAEQLQDSEYLKTRLADLVSESYRTSKLLIDQRWAEGTIDRLAREKEADALNQWTKTTRQRIREAADDELVELSQAISALQVDADTGTATPLFTIHSLGAPE